MKSPNAYVRAFNLDHDSEREKWENKHKKRINVLISRFYYKHKRLKYAGYRG